MIGGSPRSEVGVAVVGAEHLEDAVVDGQDADVERAAAERSNTSTIFSGPFSSMP